MTIGIYLLKFNNTHKVYIGQSSNIEQRWKKHQRDFKNNTQSVLLNIAYNTYGIPILEIILECCLSDLDSSENDAIVIYNSFKEGFNTLEYSEDIPRYKGETHGRSLYSNDTIISVLDYIISNPADSFDKVSLSTGVSTSNIYLIANGTNHRWLSEVFPEKYASMLSLIGTRKATCQSASNRGVIYPPIISPEGIIYTIENIKSFARQHGLDDGHLGKVLNHKRKTHKGWKLVDA